MQQGQGLQDLTGPIHLETLGLGEALPSDHQLDSHLLDTPYSDLWEETLPAEEVEADTQEEEIQEVEEGSQEVPFPCH